MPMYSSELAKELASLLNRVSAENNSNTPDYILATFLLNCLEAFDFALQQREQWYGRPIMRKCGECLA